MSIDEPPVFPPNQASSVKPGPLPDASTPSAGPDATPRPPGAGREDGATDGDPADPAVNMVNLLLAGIIAIYYPAIRAQLHFSKPFAARPEGRELSEFSDGMHEGQ